MNFTTILRLNIAGQGYQSIPSPSSDLDRNILSLIDAEWTDTDYFEQFSKSRFSTDEKLPLIPCVSFSFLPLPSFNLTYRQWFFGAVGCRWLNLSDEHGRPSLSFWHGFVVEHNTRYSDDAYMIASMLLHLMTFYQENFQQVGNRLGEIAKNPKSNVDNMIQDLMRIEDNSDKKIDTLTIDLVERISSGFLSINYPFNLKIPFPYSPLLAIPILVTLSIKRKVNVAGGMIAQKHWNKFSYVSIPVLLNTHQTISFDVEASLHPKVTEPEWSKSQAVDRGYTVDRKARGHIELEEQSSKEKISMEKPIPSPVPTTLDTRLMLLLWTMLFLLLFIIVLLVLMMLRVV